jgi:predicted transcriptional regulator YdeE
MDAAQSTHRIVEMPAWTAAGLMLDCPGFDGSGIGELWHMFNLMLGDFSEHEGRYGISLPLPDEVAGFRYWAVVKLRDGGTVPKGLDSTVVPARRYAVYPFHDHPAQMPGAFGEIYGTRLGEAGLSQDPNWVALEYYPPHWHDEAAGKFRCDLFVAIL